MYLSSPVIIQCILGISGCLLYIYATDGWHLFTALLIALFLLCILVYTLSRGTIRQTTALEDLPTGPDDRTATLEERLCHSKFVAVAGAAAGVLALIVLARNAGTASILDVARFYSNLRYSEETGMPVAVRGLNVLIYFSAIISNLVFFERVRLNAGRAYRYAIPSMLLIGEAFLLGTKSTVVLAAVYGLVSWRYVALRYGFKLRGARMLTRLSVVLCLLIVVVLSVHYIRSGGRVDLDGLLTKIFSSYLFLPFFALNTIVADQFELISVGYSSLMGVTGYFDNSLVQQQDPIYFESGGQTLVTNVYTAYFYLIEDTGLIGLCLALLLIAAAIGSLERKIMAGSTRSFAVYVCLSTYILFAFAGPVFKFLTNIAVLALLVIYILYSHSVTRNDAPLARPRSGPLHPRSKFVS